MLNSLKELYFKNKIYFIALSIFWLCGIFILLLTSHGDEIYYINSLHSRGLDTFFKYATYLGDGAVQAILLIPLLIFRFRIYLVFLVTHILSGGFSQLLKVIFVEPRPRDYFSNFAYFHQIVGEKLYSNFSFPSGHTTSIFALTVILAIITPNKGLKLLFFFLALTVAISRVYLLQHFFIDIYFGSLIGTIFGILVYGVFWNIKKYRNLHNQTLPNYIQMYRQRIKLTHQE